MSSPPRSSSPDSVASDFFGAEFEKERTLQEEKFAKESKRQDDDIITKAHQKHMDKIRADADIASQVVMKELEFARSQRRGDEAVERLKYMKGRLLEMLEENKKAEEERAAEEENNITSLLQKLSSSWQTPGGAIDCAAMQQLQELTNANPPSNQVAQQQLVQRNELRTAKPWCPRDYEMATIHYQ